MRSGGQLPVECLVALGAAKRFGVPGESCLAVLGVAIPPEALTPRRTLSRMRGAALAPRKARP